MSHSPVLAVQLEGIQLTCPIIGAAGTCGYVDELADAVDLKHFGAITSKSITIEPRKGNSTWRILDMPVGMLNAIGLANVGLEQFLAVKLPQATDLPTKLFGSIAGGSIDDYVTIAACFDAEKTIAAIELNVSCPNTADGLVFGEDANVLKTLVTEVASVVQSSPIFVKLSPNVGNITRLAAAAIDGGAHGLTLINTVSGLSIDVANQSPRLSVGSGGYSGPAIHPIALKIVHDVYHTVARDAGIPIIGLGGVTHWKDAAAMVLAGASAVGIGTALFANPRSPISINRGLEKWIDRTGVQNISDLTGQLHHQ